MFGGRLRKKLCTDVTDCAARNSASIIVCPAGPFDGDWTAYPRSGSAGAAASAIGLSYDRSIGTMEIIMNKLIFTAAVLLMSTTGAYAAVPGAVGAAVASCCSAIAACCEAALACCG